MDQNYSEIICTAIDEIVTARLQGLEYDITKQCTIMDDTYSHQGKYIVSDGTSRYEAFSTDTSFRKGNSVLVNIPNGDYSMQKTIMCRISADDTTPFNYTSPMDTMLKITNNIFDNAKVIHGENFGLLANDSNKSTATKPIYSLTESAGFAGFTRLGVTANFKSLLNGLDVTSGTYGLKLLLYTETSTSPGVKDNAVYELSFNSSDMIGNPYQFESYFYQEKVFDISSINNIKQIDVYFYQNGKFYDGNNNYIEWQYIDSLLGPTRLQNNLFVDDVKIYLGYDMGAFTEETLMLYTNDDLKYHYTDDPLYKTISLRWIHKIDEKTYQLLNPSDMGDEFEVHWFRYKKGHEIINQYAGNDWEELQPLEGNPFSCIFVPEISARTEQIKVIGLQKVATDDETVSTTAYYSGLMTFENEENVPDKITYDAATALSIVCEDGSEGNYFLYNQNGKIENEGNGQGNKRYLKAMFQGAEIKELGESDYIKWYFPKEKTMLKFSNDYFTENQGTKSDAIKSYYGIDYVEITRSTTKETVSGKPELTSTKQAYSIGNQWNYENSNNTVRCIVRIKGVEYEAIEELRFGKAGTNGTNTTFLIEFADNENALIINSENKTNTLTVRARLYDSNGSNVGFTTDQAKTIEWSWYKRSNSNYMVLNGNKSDVISLTCNTTTIPQDNYFILKATYGMLEAYLPIPLKTENTSHIEGAREVIYNNLGTPSYYSDAYVMYYYDGDSYEEDKTATWVRKYNDTVDAVSQDYIPSLKEISSRKGYYGLSASPFYASGYSDMVCISGSGENSGWSQPILIMQSKYDFAMLNKWDGTLTMDENNGTILSTMLGAGRKNTDNTFSGILIGDVQTGTGNTNDTNTLTGVYGLHEGVTSFELKENGTASFGKKGRGQILIDGNTSVIKSQSFDSIDNKGKDIGTGLKLDLDNGKLAIKNSGKTKIQINPTEPYLKINGEDGVTPLINIGESKYYLQSYTYGRNEGNQGTYLDLANGSFNIKGNAGSILMSGEWDVSDKDKYDLFKITNNEGLTLIEMDNDNNYYLQSSHYLGQKIKEVTIGTKDYKIYKVPDNRKTIKNGSSTITFNQYVGIIGNEVYKASNALDSFSLVTFQKTTIVYTEANSNASLSADTVTYSPTEYAQWFIAALIPVYENVVPSGLKIDLNAGSIHGYDLYLRGINSEYNSVNNKAFTFDSSADEFPVLVGDNFKIAWDGSLTCTNINALTVNTKNEKDYVININDNFYVTPSGGAGGSGVRFSGSFGGYCSGTGVFEKLVLNGNTLTCTSLTYVQSLQSNSVPPGGYAGPTYIAALTSSNLYYSTKSVTVKTGLVSSETITYVNKIALGSPIGTLVGGVVTSGAQKAMGAKVGQVNIVGWGAVAST